MIHEILPVGPLQCNCSVIGDETTREAMVIDPGDDINDVLALVHKHTLQVKQIVITHAHIDHVGGAMKLRAATGAPILSYPLNRFTSHILFYNLQLQMPSTSLYLVYMRAQLDSIRRIAFPRAFHRTDLRMAGQAAQRLRLPAA